MQIRGKTSERRGEELRCESESREVIGEEERQKRKGKERGGEKNVGRLREERERNKGCRDICLTVSLPCSFQNRNFHTDKFWIERNIMLPQEGLPSS